MTKQTAVEWLVNILKESIDPEDGSIAINWLHDGTLDQAKAMEKEQIVDAFNEENHEFNGWKRVDLSGEQYYNETYGGDK